VIFYLLENAFAAINEPISELMAGTSLLKQFLSGAGGIFVVGCRLHSFK
jgi:coenzyme F420-reducing hydrogenase delta subunit